MIASSAGSAVPTFEFVIPSAVEESIRIFPRSGSGFPRIGMMISQLFFFLSRFLIERNLLPCNQPVKCRRDSIERATGVYYADKNSLRFPFCTDSIIIIRQGEEP